MPVPFIRVASVPLTLALLGSVSIAGTPDLPEARPVPDVQVLPLPDDQASFQYQGVELTRYHFGATLKRPFLYPVQGPEGRSLTRMGHPHDPLTHSHHNSVWISHQNVGGVNFWEDRSKPQIVCQRVEQYEDGPKDAWMLSVNAWNDGDGKTVMAERRRIAVQRLGPDQLLIIIDMQLESPGGQPLVIGESPFGMIGVRMAKTIGVHDGGGRILNSAGQLGEPQVFRQPARWVDYSGPVTNQAAGGITLLDHPANPGHPTPFHVRGDGWMGASLTLRKAITVEPGHPIRLRYAIWAHAGVPKADEIDARWQEFSLAPLPAMQRISSPTK